MKKLLTIILILCLYSLTIAQIKIIPNIDTAQVVELSMNGEIMKDNIFDLYIGNSNIIITDSY